MIEPGPVPNDTVSVNRYAHDDPDPDWIVNERWQCVRILTG